MASPLIHAKSSVKKYGGCIEDYIEIHEFFDQTKGHVADFRHRSILHNSFGMLLAEQFFGSYITNSDGRQVEVRQISYDHIMEDCGKVPSIQDWVMHIQPQPWMMKGGESRKLTQELSTITNQ
jgi:hypothetical protein